MLKTQKHIFNCQICRIQSLYSFEDQFSIIDKYRFFFYVYELNFESFFFFLNKSTLITMDS